MRAALFLLCAGCLQTVHRPGCAETRTPVGDDDPTDAGTASELLALVVGEGSAQGTRAPDDRPVGVGWEVSRGEGGAAFVRSEPTDVVSHQLGIGGMYLDLMAICEDRLEVPVEARVWTSDGAVSVAGSASAARTVEPSQVDQTDAVTATGSFRAGSFPPVDDDPAAFTDKSAYVILQGLSTDAPSGRAGWEGTRETEDFVEDAAHDVARFGDPI